MKLGDQKDDHESREGDRETRSPGDPAGDRNDRDTDREVPGVQRASPAFPWSELTDALVDASVDLAVDPVEEARHELVVMGRTELAPRFQRRRQLGLNLARVHVSNYRTGREA
jgi:hypothetical protein